MRLAVLTLAVLAVTALPGCGEKDPVSTKPGGGGRPQSYTRDTGRYDLILGTAAVFALLGWAAARRRRNATLLTA